MSFEVTERSFDPIKLVYITLIFLLGIGVLPFTAGVVALVLMVGTFGIEVRY